MYAGHSRTGTSVWLALTLWTIMALGEAALMAQSSMCLAVWCALFGLPSLYLSCRHILDLLVEEALQLVAAFLRPGVSPLSLTVCSCCVASCENTVSLGLAFSTDRVPKSQLQTLRCRTNWV